MPRFRLANAANVPDRHDLGFVVRLIWPDAAEAGQSLSSVFLSFPFSKYSYHKKSTFMAKIDFNSKE
jgi:hypothetical protein